MLPSPDGATLTDPVCGRPVPAASPHRVVHGGALFAFCSAACRAHFVELPSRYAVIMSAVAARTAGTNPSAPAPLGIAVAPPAVVKPASQPPTRAAAAPSTAGTAGTATIVATPTIDLQALGTAPGKFSWVLAWRERRFAARCARDMLELHCKLSTRYPELKGTSLYRRVVASRVGDDMVAETVLQHAQQSFAIWPVERALNFRDVVHYVAVSEFIKTHKRAGWVHADMRRIVEAMIPQDL